MKKKKVVISCGPIPARLDSVKFVTNMFRGGLAFRTANFLCKKQDIDLTIVKWVHTNIEDAILLDCVRKERVHVVDVMDVIEYFSWFSENAVNYDAFIMAAAVANLMPANPYNGKFPSHHYKVGETFQIPFEIAPRAIDIIKQKNPRATLIGYKLFDGTEEELIHAARITLQESRANVIFANTPKDAKLKKLAVFSDNAVVSCSFDEHLTYIDRLLYADFFRTVVEPLSKEEEISLHIRQAFNIVRMYEKSMPMFGTVAVPVYGDVPNRQMFATTARGHNGDPVLVRAVDFKNCIVFATGKATLNAPALASAISAIQQRMSDMYAKAENLSEQTSILRRISSQKFILVHRHTDDPCFDNDTPFDEVFSEYLLTGTKEEAMAVGTTFYAGANRVKLFHHGDITIRKIESISWNKYYEQFPKRYFETPALMHEVLDKYQGTGTLEVPERYFETPALVHEFLDKYQGTETLEVGGNKSVCTKYALDPYVSAENAICLTYTGIDKMPSDCMDLTICRNAINYLSEKEILSILRISKHFVANTFLVPPKEKVTDKESAVLSQGMMYHTLRLENDNCVQHIFYGYDRSFYESLGLTVVPYGKNSALLIKNINEDS